ncbi:TPR repeat protein [Candidatus Burarchaeum australiense]|nr:TPR repeat protein [Candidatus Burarchaeum australiense]
MIAWERTFHSRRIQEANKALLHALSTANVADVVHARRIAEKAYGRARWKTQLEPAFNLRLSDAHLQHARITGSSGDIEAALECNPNNAEALLFAGQLRYNQGWYEKAAYHLSTLLMLEPDNKEARHLCGRAYHNLSKTSTGSMAHWYATVAKRFISAAHASDPVRFPDFETVVGKENLTVQQGAAVL